MPCRSCRKYRPSRPVRAAAHRAIAHVTLGTRARIGLGLSAPTARRAVVAPDPCRPRRSRRRRLDARASRARDEPSAGVLHPAARMSSQTVSTGRPRERPSASGRAPQPTSTSSRPAAASSAPRGRTRPRGQASRRSATPSLSTRKRSTSAGSTTSASPRRKARSTAAGSRATSSAPSREPPGRPVGANVLATGAV